MTPVRSRTALAAAAVAALLLSPVVCAAAPSSSDPLPFGVGTGTVALAALTANAQTRAANDFLADAVARSTSALPGNASFAANDGGEVRGYTQSASASRNPLSARLRGDSDLALWNLVAMVHAQQRGNTFDLVDTNVASVRILELQTAPVSPVPLPGAVWLFLMGALGLAGTRITGISGKPRDTRVHADPVPA